MATIYLSPAGFAQPVVTDPVLDFLDELSTIWQANCDKLQTWEGVYRFEIRNHFSHVPGEKGRATMPYWQDSKGEIRFKRDFRNDLLYSHRVPDGQFAFTDVATGQSRKVGSSATPPNDEVILTPEHMLHSPWAPRAQLPKSGGLGTVDPGFVEGLPNNRGRVILRVDKTREAIAFDPKFFFSFSFSGNVDAKAFDYEVLRRYVDTSRKFTPDQLEQSRVKWDFSVSFENNSWVYRKLPRSGTGYSIVGRFDATEHRNCIEWTEGDSIKPSFRYEVGYAMQDGISFPNEFIETYFENDGVTVKSRNKMTLVRSTFNRPIDPSEFQPSALAHTNGTRLIDTLSGTATRVFRDGDWLTIPEYNKFVATEVTNPSKRFFIWSTIAIIVVLLLLVLRERKAKLTE